MGLLAAVSARSVRSAVARAVARTSAMGAEESVEVGGWEMPPAVWVSRLLSGEVGVLAGGRETWDGATSPPLTAKRCVPQGQGAPGSPGAWQVGQVPMTTVTGVRCVAPECVDAEARCGAVRDGSEGADVGRRWRGCWCRGRGGCACASPIRGSRRWSKGGGPLSKSEIPKESTECVLVRAPGATKASGCSSA